MPPLPRKSLALALLAATMCGSAAATAPSPAQYRSRLNAMCRSNTVKLRQLEAELKRAQQANDAKAYGFAFGRLLAIGLREDAAIEAAPIPASLRAQMVPAVRQLHAADALVRKALARFAAGDAAGAMAALGKIDSVAGSVDRHLDAAGLRDCGSNQS